MTGIKITVVEDTVSPQLRFLLAKIEHLQPLYRTMGQYLLESVKLRFDSQTSPSGIPWASLSARYAKSRLKKDSEFPNSILRRTGKLSTSPYFNAFDDLLEIGSPEPYAAIHQYGGTVFSGQRAGRVLLSRSEKGVRFAKESDRTAEAKPYATGYYEVVIPARPFLGFSFQDQSALLTQALDYLSGA